MLEFSEKQMEFLREPLKPINFLEGAVSSGKTVVVNWKAVMEIAVLPHGAKGIICGDTYDTVKENVLMPLESMVGRRYLYYNKNGGKLFGRPFVIKGFDKADSEKKIRGATLKWGIVDEVTLAHRKFFDMLTTRMRDGHDCWLMCTCNPDDPKHYIRTEYMDNPELQDDIKKVHFNLEDNPFLSPAYVERVKRMYAGVFYERFILGKWVRAEGLIYRDFANHFRDYETNTFPTGMHLSIGIDYGASKSDGKFQLVGIAQDFSCVYCLSEKRIKGVQSPDTIYKAFIDWWTFISHQYGKCYSVYADYGALGQVLTQGLSIACQKAGLGIKIADCSKGKIIDRIELTLALMAQGHIKYSSDSKELVDAWCTAVWEDDKIDVRLDDGTVDVDSLDSFEYAVFPFAKQLLRRI